MGEHRGNLGRLLPLQLALLGARQGFAGAGTRLQELTQPAVALSHEGRTVQHGGHSHQRLKV